MSAPASPEASYLLAQKLVAAMSPKDPARRPKRLAPCACAMSSISTTSSPSSSRIISMGSRAIDTDPEYGPGARGHLLRDVPGRHEKVIPSNLQGPHQRRHGQPRRLSPQRCLSAISLRRLDRHPRNGAQVRSRPCHCRLTAAAPQYRAHASSNSVTWGPSMKLLSAMTRLNPLRMASATCACCLERFTNGTRCVMSLPSTW